jgi:two-component system, cell cycle response regulator DivK
VAGSDGAFTGGEMSRILIVEDNLTNLKLVRDILQARGYETMDATTAEEGLALARLHRFELVLMDIQLPGMSGVEALGCLRADDATRRIPVLAVTASVASLDRLQTKGGGFDGCISKPISVRAFMQTVDAFLGNGA